MDSEDGSWEGSVDWWPRPQSPPPGSVADAYYPPTEHDSGISSAGVFATASGGGSGGGGGGLTAAHHFANPSSGQQGATSLLPSVPTFEESGTRVSWADYRGHRLAEVRGEAGAEKGREGEGKGGQTSGACGWVGVWRALAGFGARVPPVLNYDLSLAATLAVGHGGGQGGDFYRTYCVLARGFGAPF